MAVSTYDLAVRDLKQWGKEIDALAELDPRNYDEVLLAAARIEDANPRFKSTEHVLAFLIPGFLQTLSARTQLSYPEEDYAHWIGIISTQYPHPLMLVSIVGFMFKHTKDPTILVKEFSHKLLDPVWFAEAEEEEKRLANGMEGSGTSQPNLSILSVSIDLAVRDRKQWAKEIYALEELDPRKVEELAAAASALEQANPRFKNTEHVLAFLIPEFLHILSGRIRLSYPAEDYAQWMWMISTQYQQPLMLVSVFTSMLKHVEDPTILLKKFAQLPFDPVWIANAEAEVEKAEQMAAGSGEAVGTKSEPKPGPRLVTSSKPVSGARSSARSEPAMDQQSMQYLFKKLLAERGEATRWYIVSFFPEVTECACLGSVLVQAPGTSHALYRCRQLGFLPRTPAKGIRAAAVNEAHLTPRILAQKEKLLSDAEMETLFMAPLQRGESLFI